MDGQPCRNDPHGRIVAFRSCDRDRDLQEDGLGVSRQLNCNFRASRQRAALFGLETQFALQKPWGRISHKAHRCFPPG
jgi:hypothetical protein